VLDSYWRPIHVGVASLSYGVALVCFAVAVIYLLKAGSKVERMAIWSSVFGFAVIASISKFSVLTGFVYRAGLFVPNESGGKPFSAPFRIEIPNTGVALAIAGILLGTAAILLSIDYFKGNESIRRAGMVVLKVAFVAQIISIVLFIYRDQFDGEHRDQPSQTTRSRTCAVHCGWQGNCGAPAAFR
jgi:hypothetical protein